MTTITMQIYIYVDAAWVDVTADTLANDYVSANWGMASNKPNDFIAKTGTMNFTLKNETGRFLPGGASVISADWDKGTKVKAVFTYDSQSYIRFYGVVNKLDIVKLPLSNSRVRVSCVDWLDYAAKFPLQNPAIQLDKRMDEAMTTIVDAMAIQPLARDFSAGLNTFPTIFNDATQFTLGLSEFSKLATSELGYIYVKKDPTYGETLRAESAGSRVLSTPRKKVKISQEAGFLLQENGDKLLQQNNDKLLLEAYTLQDVTVNDTMTDFQVDYGENLINRIVVNVNPTRIADKDSLLFSLDSPVYLDAGTEKIFDIQFTEENSKRLVAALPPESSYPTTLLHFDAPNGEELILDSGGHPFDDYNMQLINSPKKLGAAAGYFAGNAYIDANSSVDHDLTGNFTIEYWAYYYNATAGGAVVARGAAGYVPFVMGYPDGANALLYMSSNGSSWNMANGLSFGAITLNTWTKYSLCRSGNNFYMAVNGNIVNTFTSSATVPASTERLIIGKYNSAYITAALDELRIIKGLAKYTSSYTPETEPLDLSGLIYTAWSKENGTGTELTTDFSLSVTYGAAGATITVSNVGTAVGWLTYLKIFGKIVETTSKLSNVQEDVASITQYSEHELTIDQIYQQDFTSGREEASKILETNKKPLVRVNSLAMNANRDEAHTRYFLDTDVGDVVKIIEPVTETNADFFIQGMDWRARAGSDGNAIVDFGWTVKKFREAYSSLALKMFSQVSVTTGDYVDFGYLPAVGVEAVPYRVWSFWAKFNAITISHSQTFFDNNGGYAVYSGYRLNWQAFGATLQFSVGSNGYIYYFDPFPNTPDVWIHFLVSFDAGSGSNQPRCFYNGIEELTISPDAANPYALLDSGEVGKPLRIGQKRTVNASNGTSIKDLRIYNGDQVADPAALALALYNEGAHGDDNTTGLLFRSFYVPTNDLTDYEGANLTEAQKVYDDIGRTVGTPKNSPLGEAI